MTQNLSYLDSFFGPAVPRYSGTDLDKRPTVEYFGAGVSVADDPGNQRTAVTIPGSVVSGSGEVTIDMNDADYVAPPNEYGAGIIKNGSTTPQTGDRALQLPNAVDASAYVRFIRNANGATFGLVVYGVAGFTGTTVTIADGFGAWVGIDSTGAFRMSPDMAP